MQIIALLYVVWKTLTLFGIHTGDSIVVAPALTLDEKTFDALKTASLNIIKELKINGGCNVQFALKPDHSEYAVIEVNPRVSRSSALASKATGYPIARVATKTAIGYTLDEIISTKNGSCFEPKVNYTVIKIPKWPFGKFLTATRELGTQMKATGEVMSIGTSLESALMKAVRSLEENVDSLILPKLSLLSDEDILTRLSKKDNERLFVVAESLRRFISYDEIYKITMIDKFFLKKINNIVKMEMTLSGVRTGMGTHPYKSIY